MDEMVRDLLLAYRQIRAARARERAYKRLIGKTPDYTLIRELIEGARVDAVATVTFVDGTKVDIRRKDPTDRLTEFMAPDKAAAW